MTTETVFEIFSIEGNIGSGKSTLFEELKNVYSCIPNIVFLEEPVSEWEKIKNKRGEPMLQLFYRDPKKYSFSFQMMAFISRLAILKKTIESNKGKKIIIITERSLYTDKHVFARMLYDKHNMEDVEHQIYLNWFDTFVNEYPVDNVIYIKTSPKKCHERINKRARVGEGVIPLQYLEECHMYHENFLDKTVGIKANQLLLNGNVDIFQNTDVLNGWIRQIDAFISPDELL